MMRHLLKIFAACFAVAVACIVPASAQTESVILEFQDNATTGEYPQGALVSGADGSIYGTTTLGFNGGTVFKLTPQAGAWKYNLLYSFSNAKDGFFPSGNLVLGRTRKIYGTTQGANESYSTGVVYELAPPAKPGSPWTETVLYTFTGGADGGQPMNGVIADSGGKLYGTTRLGGKFGYGTIFRLSPPAQVGGAWKETVLYSFQLQQDSGSYPNPTGLALENGSLYGATSAFTRYNDGVLFQLSPPTGGQGQWNLKVLYAFTGNADGAQPSGQPDFR